MGDTAEKEAERLARIMNKGSVRRTANSARPVSWNVHLTGRAVTGAASKSEQDEALRLLQEQLKSTDISPALSIAASHEAKAEQPYHNKPPSTVVSPREEIQSPPLNLEDQAELNAFNAFNEQRELERINKWTRGGGKGDGAPKSPHANFEKPIPAVLIRQFEPEEPKKATVAPSQPQVRAPSPAAVVVEDKYNGSHHDKGHDAKEQEKVQDLTQYHDGVVKFSNNVTVAAKAIRQKNNEALVKACWAVVLSAKTLALFANDDPEIISWTKALEAATTQVRTAGSGSEHYYELSTALGHLYLSVISLH